MSSAPPGPAYPPAEAPASPAPTPPPPGSPHGGPYGGGQPNQEAYGPSGLTAADLTFNTPQPSRGGAIWKTIGAVVGVLVLLVGAGAGGWFLRDLRGDGNTGDPTANQVRTADDVTRSLGKDGFDCTEAFTTPVTVDLCYRESAEYRETVGLQLLGKERITWLKVRIDARDPERAQVKDAALSLFGTVLDEALVAGDAKLAKEWLATNYPTDYDKSDYLTHEVGGVRLQMLPHLNDSAVLWVRLTAATYQSAGEKTLPKVTAESLEKHHTDDGYKCSPREGAVTCEKEIDSGDSSLAYGVEGDKVTALRLSTVPSGDLESAAPDAKKGTIGLVSLMLSGKDLDAAKEWLDGAFDGKPRTKVIAGLEIRVNPVSVPSEGRSQYDVDLRPASW